MQVLLEALFQVECDEGKPRGHYSAGGKFTLAARKIEMGVVRWLFLTLLGWWPSGATRSTYPCDVPLKTICVPGSSSSVPVPVPVPCPKMTADEMVFNLFKDQQVISNVTCNHEGDALNCTPPPPHATVAVEMNRGNMSVWFVLDGVTDDSQATYRCEGNVIYPPPWRKVSSALRVQVLVEGHICKCNKGSGNHGDGPGRRFDWIWMLVVALLSIYSVAVTILAVVNWVRWRNTDSQSDYMNTKPIAPRDRRRKKGVQKPIPRHF